MGKVGYRFYPTEQELLEYFLYNKITENPILDDDDDDPVKVCNLYGDKEPWDLWNNFGGNNLLKDGSLYFFTRLKKLSPNGSRFNRKIGSGAWQGEDGAKPVFSGGGSDHILGFKKRFRYENRNNYEQNGGWIMYEYSINPLLLGGECSHKALDYVLCCMKKNESGQHKEKSGLGKKQTKSKHIGEKKGSEQRVLGRKRKLKVATKPDNRDDSDDENDKCVQNKRLKAEQEALSSQPTELPRTDNILEAVESETDTERYCKPFDVEHLISNTNQRKELECIKYYIPEGIDNVLEVVESETETERYCDPFDVEHLISNTNQGEELDCISYYIPEGDGFVQNKHLMSCQEALQVIEHEAETEPVFDLEEIFSNIDHEFDQVTSIEWEFLEELLL